MNEPGRGPTVVCRAAGRRFALLLSDVREVCTEVGIVRMPGVAAPVEGVANIRGAVVTVVRAADLLEGVSGSAGPSPWLVVLRYRGGRVALGVDEVEDLSSRSGQLVPLELERKLGPLFETG